MLLITPHKLGYHLRLLDYTTASVSTLKINHSGDLVKHFLPVRRTVGFSVEGRLLRACNCSTGDCGWDISEDKNLNLEWQILRIHREC